MSKKKLLEDGCFHCKMGREREKHSGVFYHTYKESNGMDYDKYTVYCSVQTPSGFELIRAEALQSLDKELQNVQKRVTNLKSHIKETKKAKTMEEIRWYS